MLFLLLLLFWPDCFGTLLFCVSTISHSDDSFQIVHSEQLNAVFVVAVVILA